MAMIEPKIIYRNLHVPLRIIDPTSPDDLFPFEKDNAALQQQHSKFITHKIYPNTGHNVHYETVSYTHLPQPVQVPVTTKLPSMVIVASLAVVLVGLPIDPIMALPMFR